MSSLSLPKLSSVFTATLLLAGCSDSVGPAPVGAYDVAFIQDPPGVCQISNHGGNIGTVSDTEKLDLKKGGTLEFEMACLVISDGQNFEVAGRMKDGANNLLTFEIPSININATRGDPATGSVNYQSAQTQNVYGSPAASPCEFYFEGSETIQPGAVWVNFSCPELVQGTSTCRTDPSVLIMENCDS